MRSDIIKFQNTVNKVRSDVLSGSIYSYWIVFSIGELEMSTFSKDNKMIMSLEASSNGSGCANKFTLTLVYTPNIIPTENSSDYGGINYVDLAILNCDRTCRFQYGYVSESGEIIQSEEYEGMITKYKNEIRDASIFYTIEGFSSIVSTLNLTIDSIPPVKNVKPTEYLKATIENLLSEVEHGNEYEVVGANGTVIGSDVEVEEIEGALETTLVQYINTVLRLATNQNEVNIGDTEDSGKESVGLNKTVYSFYIKDEKSSTGKKSIVLYSYNIGNPTDEVISNVQFNWMGARDRFMVEFSSEFNGAALMCMEKGIEKKYTVDSSGALYTLESINTSPDSGDSGSSDIKTEASSWSKQMQDVSYKANATLMGIPCVKPIGAIINVTPILYGQPHITAGEYMISKSTDLISTQSFTTSMELIKIIREKVIVGYGTNDQAAKNLKPKKYFATGNNRTVM